MNNFIKEQILSIWVTEILLILEILRIKAWNPRQLLVLEQALASLVKVNMVGPQKKNGENFLKVMN